MIRLRTSEEIEWMRENGKKIGKILQELLVMSVPGVSLQEIEDQTQKRIKEEGGVPSFSTVGDYKWATCLCINEQVVHGIPSSYVLKDGDVLTIDTGMIYKGFHSDTAWSKIIGDTQSEDRKRKERFLRVGEEALWKAISVAVAGNRVGHISQAIQQTVEGAGYSVVKDLTGHGVGKSLHEEPMIPEYVRGNIERTPLLTPGMTLAIEVIYAEGKGNIVYGSDDGWMLESRDRSLTASFEHSIAIGEHKTTVLTKA